MDVTAEGASLDLRGQGIGLPAKELIEQLQARAAGLSEALVEDRRRFHALAELGWRERNTTDAIVERLAALGFSVTSGREFLKDAPLLGIDPGAERPQTGCAAELDSGRPGPTVCLRVDIDALPITEAPAPHRPSADGWASAMPGVMHACGHDGHVAIGLGIASLLSPLVRANGAGRLRLLFQPAEEGVRGGRALVDAGWVRDVDLLLGFHIGFGVPAGTVAVGVRGFLATEKLRVRLQGRAAHAGKAPERGRNALLGACQIALGLHALAQSSAPGLRVNVGRLQAGRALNVIAEEAELLVELRAERSDDLRDLSQRARRLVEGVASAGELGHSVELIGEAAEWSNPVALARWAGVVATATGAFDHVLSDHVFGASEDATLLARAVAERGGLAGYLLLGAKLSADHHTPQFDFDEEVLPRGVLLLAAMAAAALLQSG
ncbi:MAG: Catalyzes the cleavage of p-aminobenzoyl-glutamate to p-aminobenzoate and glutamate, subunit [Rhodospirillales bacterium]|jgi:aminobenzoyl-glutamate utilization protein A|nr:Catalyzes the cleavage of p-aminobenzoyl-glutamate to p-aminobenzoate and glutamate, subunit [Rhodospirillales bacterium]